MCVAGSGLKDNGSKGAQKQDLDIPGQIILIMSSTISITVHTKASSPDLYSDSKSFFLVELKSINIMNGPVSAV